MGNEAADGGRGSDGGRLGAAEGDRVGVAGGAVTVVEGVVQGEVEDERLILSGGTRQR